MHGLSAELIEAAFLQAAADSGIELRRAGRRMIAMLSAIYSRSNFLEREAGREWASWQAGCSERAAHRVMAKLAEAKILIRVQGRHRAARHGWLPNRWRLGPRMLVRLQFSAWKQKLNRARRFFRRYPQGIDNGLPLIRRRAPERQLSMGFTRSGPRPAVVEAGPRLTGREMLRLAPPSALPQEMGVARVQERTPLRDPPGKFAALLTVIAIGAGGAVA